MKLLFLNHNLREYGTYFRAFHIARELVRRGHSVTLWCASPEHWYRAVRETVDGVEIVETPSWNPVIGRDDGWGPLDIGWRALHLNEQKWDLIYAFAHPPNVSWIATLAEGIWRIPVVVDWCDVYRDGIFPLRREIRAYQRTGGFKLWLQRCAERMEERMERSVLESADGVTVISSYLMDETIKLGIQPENVLLFPSGANLDAIRPMDKLSCRAELRAQGVEINDDAMMLGYIANYNPDERFFLAALRDVFTTHPNARLLAACPEFTPSVVEQMGVGANLVALGRRPFSEMNHILGASDILLLPLEDNLSNRGRWPNKFGDYLAAGRPVATCEIGDVAQYFPQVESESGREEIGVITPCESDAFARGIIELISRSEQHAEMGAAARRLAEGELAWPKLAERVETFLQAFVERSASHE